ncbi:MAG: prolyl oligopeptidase family serine peptidase [Niabella sp.]
MKKIGLIITIFLLAIGQQGIAQNYDAFQKCKFMQNGDTLPYRILLPENFNPSKKYPLVVFLHGRGESGNENERQLTHGAALFLNEKNRKDFPAIVVFPQNPVRCYWSNVQTVMNDKGKRSFYFVAGGEASPSMKMVIALVNNLFVQYKIQKNQVYAMGLSMGGMGTFELVNRMPTTFAAAIPICGGANPAIASNIKNTDWWVFHGAKDDVVLPTFSENMVKAMKRNGVNVKFTLYPNANHNSWDSAFAEPELLKWLFSKKMANNLNKENNN